MQLAYGPATMNLIPLLGLLIALSSQRSGTDGSDWPQFRGPNGNGVVLDAGIPLTWSEGENVAWKVAIHGQGWSQPVVVGGHRR